MIAAGDASPAARDMPVEDVLDQCAEAMAIDRSDETSFDSNEFPKAVFLDWSPPTTPAPPATARSDRHGRPGPCASRARAVGRAGVPWPPCGRVPTRPIP